jgi:hypothetical protein
VRAFLASLLALGLLVGCSSSPKADPSGFGCDANCQSEIAEADGQTAPPGPPFDYDTSRCSQWNAEPSSIRTEIAWNVAKKYGANNYIALGDELKKAITVTCKSYTHNRVAHVVTILIRIAPSGFANPP